jgi:hypothetical protein
MDKIKEQANKVSQLVFASETGAAYQKTLALTWAILRETGVLLWLVVCLVFVGSDWFWHNSIRLGRSARSWYTSFSQEPQSSEQSFTATGQSLVEVGKSGAAYLLTQARQQLGLSEQPAASVPPAAAVPPATPVPTPPVTPVSTPTPAGPPAPAGAGLGPQPTAVIVEPPISATSSALEDEVEADRDTL